MSSSRKSIAYHLLFALSGFAALGLQSAWTRVFAFSLGHEIPATLGVVTAVFAGLAMGAWTSDCLCRFTPHPAMRCALLEAIIGIWALATAWMLPWVGSVPMGRDGSWAAGFLLPLVALLPATWAMGATLPAVENLVSAWHRDGRRIGPLYAANTAGAALGVMVSIWWIQPWLGLRLTTVCLASIHLLCAAGFFFSTRVKAGRILTLPLLEARASSPAALHHKPERPGTAAPPGFARQGLRTRFSNWGQCQDAPVMALTPAEPLPAKGVVISGRHRLRWTLALTGFLGIGFEMLATRLLGQTLEGTVYSHAIVLAVYLGGTAGGAALRNRWIRDPAASLPSLLLAQALTLALSGYLLLGTPFLHPMLRSALGDHAMGTLLSEFVIGAGVVGPPTFLMGMLFSSLASMAASGPGGSLGRAVGWNLIGGALAPAVVGAGCVSWLGSRWTLVVLGVGYLLLLPRVRRFQWLAFGGVVVLLALLPPQLHLQQLSPGARWVSVREGPGDTVAVVESSGGSRSLRVNNRFTMGGTASTNAERRHAHLPVLLHPDPRRALFLGVGTGISFAALDAHPGLTADGVELVPEIAASMPAFSPYNDFGPDLRLRVADARRFIRSGGDPYDVIIADLFHPARDGAGALYTREHFLAVRTRLSENGLFCQWLPLFQLDVPTLQIITRTFLDVFPESEAFLLRPTADTPVLGLIGARRPLQFDRAWFERRTKDPTLRDALRPLGLTDSWPFFGTWFAGRNWLEELAANAPLNMDDRPVVLFQAPRTLLGRSTPGWTLLQQLLDRPRPSSDALFPGTTDVDREWRDRLSRFLEARDLFLRGLIADATSQRAEAVDAFIGSARLSADFTTGYAQVLTRAAQLSKSDPALARGMLERLTAARPERPVADDLRRRLGL